MFLLPGYRVLTKLYESANSLVYPALREQDNQPVILKVLKQDYPTPGELTRYKQEYDPQRIEIVNVLSSQAAISIENAKLYTEVQRYARMKAGSCN
jgi:GAF domain-containing protein